MSYFEIPITQEFQQTVSIWCLKEDPKEKKDVYLNTIVETKWLITPMILQIGKKEEHKVCPFCHRSLTFEIGKAISITKSEATPETYFSNLNNAKSFGFFHAHKIGSWPSGREGQTSISRMRIFGCVDCGHVTSSNFKQCPKCNSINFTDIDSNLIKKCERCGKEYVRKGFRCPYCGYTLWDSIKYGLRQWKIILSSIRWDKPANIILCPKCESAVKFTDEERISGKCNCPECNELIDISLNKIEEDKKIITKKKVEDKPVGDFLCESCKYYNNIGACSKIHENVLSYPNKFKIKCNGKYFIAIN